MARPIAKDHDHKRAQILKRAAEVFAQEGIARASMNQVAQACGISKANIYHYHSSKDALLFDILDSYLSALRDRICALPLAGHAPAAQLEALCAEILLAYEGMDPEHKIQTEGLSRLTPDQQEVLRGYQREMVARMSAVLAANAPELAQGPRRALHETTMSVFGMLNWFYMWHPGATIPDRRSYARRVAALTLTGLSGALRASEPVTQT